MKFKSILIFSTIFCFLFFLQQKSFAQEKSGGPINRYVKKETLGLANDYIVEFLIPASNSWRIEASGDKEKRVLGRSTSVKRTEGNKIRIIITTGQKARKFANYWGSIDEWANALTIYYTPTPRRP